MAFTFAHKFLSSATVLKLVLVLKMVVLLKQTTWFKYFDSLNQSNIKINKFSNDLLSISDTRDDKNETISMLSKDKGDLILLFYCSVTKSMKLIHWCIVDIANTTWFPNPLVVALDGFQHEVAVPVLIDTDSLCVKTKIDIPTFLRLTSTKTKEDFKALTVSSSHPTKFKMAPFVVLPPFCGCVSCHHQTSLLKSCSFK